MSIGRGTVATAIVLGGLMAAFGLLANPCVANPLLVAPVLGVVTGGTVLFAVAAWRAQGSVLASILAASAVAAVGFVIVLMVTTQTVFVLC